MSKINHIGLMLECHPVVLVSKLKQLLLMSKHSLVVLGPQLKQITLVSKVVLISNLNQVDLISVGLVSECYQTQT